MSYQLEHNKRLVLAFVKEMGSPDPVGPFRYVARDFRLSGGILTGEMGLDEATVWRRSMVSAFPDMKVRLASGIMLAEKDTVAVRVRWTGTHRGEFRGIPATGRTVDVSLFAFFRVRNGLIDRVTQLTDSLALVEQIRGAVPADAVPSARDPPFGPDSASSTLFDRFYIPPENLPRTWGSPVLS